MTNDEKSIRHSSEQDTQAMQAYAPRPPASNPNSNSQPWALALMRVAGWALAGLIVALVVAVVYAARTFGMALYPMPKDLQDLIVFLIISGAVSIGLGALAFLAGLGTRIPSLTIT